MRTFEYEGHIVSIIPDFRKGKAIFWFCVDRQVLDFVSSASLASSLACRFIDVTTDAHYMTSRNASNYKIQ